jgi:hypothetical protein
VKACHAVNDDEPSLALLSIPVKSSDDEL